LTEVTFTASANATPILANALAKICSHVNSANDSNTGIHANDAHAVHSAIDNAHMI
jgi:hypothetical protein